jgi:hypothetical protein
VKEAKLPPMSEAGLLALVLDIAAVHGWRSAHFRPARVMRRGQPGWATPVQGNGKGFVDVVLVRPARPASGVPGRVLWVELKRDGERLRPDQERWRDWLLAAGQEYFCWRPKDLDAIERELGG